MLFNYQPLNTLPYMAYSSRRVHKITAIRSVFAIWGQPVKLRPGRSRCTLSFPRGRDLPLVPPPPPGFDAYDCMCFYFVFVMCLCLSACLCVCAYVLVCVYLCLYVCVCVCVHSCMCMHLCV